MFCMQIRSHEATAAFAPATLHLEHSIRGLNRNVAILLNMQSRSCEATVTPRRRDLAANIVYNMSSQRSRFYIIPHRLSYGTLNSIP